MTAARSSCSKADTIRDVLARLRRRYDRRLRRCAQRRRCRRAGAIPPQQRAVLEVVDRAMIDRHRVRRCGSSSAACSSPPAGSRSVTPTCFASRNRRLPTAAASADRAARAAAAVFRIDVRRVSRSSACSRASPRGSRRSNWRVFAAAIASAVMRGISTSCGCFGPSDPRDDVVAGGRRAMLGFALIAVIIAWRAPGALALDRRMEDAE